MGGGPVDSNITLEDELPAGIAPASSDCEAQGRLVTCTITGDVESGDIVSKFIPVIVEPAAAGQTLKNVVTIRGGGAQAAEASVETEIAASPPGFGFLAADAGLSGLLSGLNVVPPSRAGSVPYELTIDAGFPSVWNVNLVNAGSPRSLLVEFPPGLVFDPTAVPRCQETQLMARQCPLASQVGEIAITTVVSGPSLQAAPLYNMVPPAGSASSIGFDAGRIGVLSHLLGYLRSDDFGLSAGTDSILTRYSVLGMQLQLWGDPSDPHHDAVRGGSVEPAVRPFITMPSACGPLAFTAHTESWESPGSVISRTVPFRDAFGAPLEVEGCGSLRFEPTVSVKPSTSVADSPSGLEATLVVPQDRNPTGTSDSSLRSAEVTLPAGMSINPAAASGLAACTPAEIGLATPVGQARARFDDSEPSCPEASRLGTVEAVTPLLEDEPEAGKPTSRPLVGSIYLAQPGRNPFGSEFALYAVAEDPETGTVIKLAGEVRADPASGLLTAAFSDLPQLPIERFELDFFNGPRGPLRTPAVCGTAASSAEFAPWSGSAPVAREDRFAVVSAPHGPCAWSADQQPDAPRFDAGSVTPRAGASSPFVLHLSRLDGSKELGALNVTLPPGLTGKLAGTPTCPEAALAAAAAKSAGAEEANPSCPAASRVGTVVTGLGAGILPLQVSGDVYLAGGYRGAPVSLAVITPAAAGPFDLGTVVVRVALFVDPNSGRVRAESDPFPRQLAGVPLDLRSLTLELSKPGLMLNPTSCEPTKVEAESIPVGGQAVPLVSSFQVGECRKLPFKPKLALSLTGALARNGHPAVRASLRMGAGAAAKSARFQLPAGELLELGHVKSLCPRGVAPAHCPPASRLGFLRLRSPSLDQSLAGAVYLRAPSQRLPDLTAEVSSGPFRFLLRGRTTAAGGRIGVSLGSLPDMPVSKAVLTLAGGRRGVIVNSRSLCRGPGVATATVVAHSGKRRQFRVRPRLGTDC